MGRRVGRRGRTRPNEDARAREPDAMPTEEASADAAPARMVAPPSGAVMLATVTKPVMRPDFGSRAEKNF